jgi:hypothetical protein
MSESVSLRAVSGGRCSDADREWTSERLRDAAADGRLTMDELEDRLGGVYAARYHHELDTLVADLPRGARPRAPGWLAVLAVAWAQLRVDLVLLLGRGGSGWTRRRVVIAAIVALLLIVVIVSAIGGFAFEGGEHHGFENHGFDGPGGF